MWKFKSWKGKDKCLFFLTVGVILCILAFPAGSLSRKTSSGAKNTRQFGTDRNGLLFENGSRETADGAAKKDGAAASVSLSAIETAARTTSTYEEELERRVREILKNVDGVGTVDVMVVLKSTSAKVIHVDESVSLSNSDETDSSGGTRKMESREQQKTTVMTSQDGQNIPVVEKEMLPELSGIIISASGGGSPAVRAEISAAMEALFDLPAHKIKVLKRVE